MHRLLLPALLVLGIVLTGCSRFPTYTGPEVTQVIVHKSSRQLILMHHDEVLRSYEMELGFAPEGDKEMQGDGRTPEGSYVIDRRNPESQFYLSIGISYPNAEDIAEAEALGENPGGDIFIHGTPNPLRRGDDWTAGCIAISNREMRQVYSMVRLGTPIDILP